jgi:hypothetical protein
MASSTFNANEASHPSRNAAQSRYSEQSPLKWRTTPVLRIDETSKTLVAPQATEVVQDTPPAPEEILEMACSSWDAFMEEVGHASLRFVARQPVAGVDALAFDESTGRVVVVQFTGGDQQVTRALTGAARVAAMDAASLADIHEALTAAVPGDSPQVVLIGSGLDETAAQTVDFLVRRHGMEITVHTLVVFRFGNDKLMSVRRDYPPTDSHVDPAAEVKRILANAGHAVSAGLAPVGNGHSTPPPAL